MKVGSRDYYERCWDDLQPHIGHLHIEEVDTSAIDALKSKFSPTLGPKSVNNRLSLLKAVLRFMWKRGHLPSVPYVPMESVPERSPEWYTEEERDRLLDGIFEMHPQWYAFFYLTTRLGLRAGEVYAVARSRIRDVPPQLIVGRSVRYSELSVFASSVTTKWAAIRWPARPPRAVTPSKPSRLSSGTSPSTAPTNTRTSGSVRSSDWWPIWSPPRHLMSTSGQRAERARRRQPHKIAR